MRRDQNSTLPPRSSSAHSAPSNSYSKQAINPARTSRSQTQFLREDEHTSSDDEDFGYALTPSSSTLSDPPLSLQPLSETETTRQQVTARNQSKKGFATPHKSPLVQRQKDEERKAAQEAKKNLQKKKVFTKSVKSQRTQEQREQWNEAHIDAKDVAKANKLADTRTKRDAEKVEKLNEIQALMARGAQAPAPWPLQLPDLAPRQNTSGRNFPLKLIPDDPTFPLTNATRVEFISILMDAMRDSRQAEDTVSITTTFWYMWLKPGVEGKYSYDELDMERVCPKLVNVAEALHTHGLSATDVYCRRTIDKAMAATAMTLKERIVKLALLMRKSKSRCNDFLLGNTLEDTIALIDIKLADQKSNAINNRLRSMKVEQSNKLLGLQKGEKWPRDNNGQPILFTGHPAPGHGVLESSVPDSAVNNNDEPVGELTMLDTEAFQQPYIAGLDVAQYHEGLQDQTLASSLAGKCGFELPGDMEPLHVEFGVEFQTTTPRRLGFTGLEGLHGHVPHTEMHNGNIHVAPAALHAPASMVPLHMVPPYDSSIDDSVAFGAREANQTRIEQFQSFVPPNSMPRIGNLHPELGISLLNGNREAIIENHRGYSMYGSFLGAQGNLAAGEVEDEPRRIELPHPHVYPTFPRVKRNAQDGSALEVGDGTGAEVADQLIESPSS